MHMTKAQYIWSLQVLIAALQLIGWDHSKESKELIAAHSLPDWAYLNEGESVDSWYDSWF